MSDIFEEVDESLAQDKMAKLWSQWRYVIYTVIAAIVLGVGGWEIYNWQSDNSQKASADQFYSAQQALEANDYVAADALLSNIQQSDDPFSSLAGHLLAYSRFVGMGDRAGAIGALEETGSDDGVFGQAALMKAAYLKSGDMQTAELEAYLAPITENAESPYADLAKELIAARAFQLGDIEDAQRRFNRIAVSLDASDATKERAEQALSAIQAVKQSQGTAQ
ncbi:MAG: hypothetical protein CMK07_15205 [Ponticaulis sp.]|nr:hypothetical protein [Ponticaulis sp.]